MQKIIAVIPARAGSKGIPNKNIRLVNGRPLIWYAIDNAKRCKLITDVIVTTDSREIEIVARQMDVHVHWRDTSLCQDDITLDAVIFDAIKNKEADYVITMQPTSPTLKVETLEQAIDYSLKSGTDTLISAINKPHLSWRNEEGKKVPNYVKRLNRQYLPSHYIETGAFVISKANIITQETRIGNSVDIFEVSEEEAVDVDNFEDLKIVETILQRQNIAFYVNGNNKRGMGHIYRALELADEFFAKPDIYYDINQTSPDLFGKTAHHLIGVNGIGELLTILKKNCYTYFINDVLTTSIDYMIALRQALPNAKIINFEDDGEGIYKADLVVNALYQDSDLKHVKTGEKYYISSKLFMFYEPIIVRENVKNVFISFGGADPQNYTDRLMKIIVQEKYKDISFKVVLGRAKLNVDELMKFNEFSNIDVYYDIANMPEIMYQCDIGITSRGRTGYELAMLGIPCIAMAQNFREEKHGFVDGEHGFTYIGLNPSDYVIQSSLDMYLEMSQKDRLLYHQKLLTNDLRNGRKRVMNIIQSL